MNITPKKETVVENITTKEVDGVKVYVVEWNALEGHYTNSPHLVDSRRKAKAFINEQDANDFANTLKKALRLLQFDIVDGITITEQE